MITSILLLVPQLPMKKRIIITLYNNIVVFPWTIVEPLPPVPIWLLIIIYKTTNNIDPIINHCSSHLNNNRSRRAERLDLLHRMVVLLVLLLWLPGNHHRRHHPSNVIWRSEGPNNCHYLRQVLPDLLLRRSFPASSVADGPWSSVGSGGGSSSSSRGASSNSSNVNQSQQRLQQLWILLNHFFDH